MLLKQCSRCKNLMPYGRVYCDTCAPIVEEEKAQRVAKAKAKYNREYNKRRDPKYGAFYRGSQWRRLARARIQADGYKCVKCGSFATEVDHIIPIQTPDGWDRRYDFDNLQSLCTRCHNEKHNRFNKRGRRGEPGPRPIQIE